MTSQPLNILLSTTRSWNCGDDFIAYGVRRLIDDITGRRNNYVAYNRNPDLHMQRINAHRLDLKNKAGEIINSIDLTNYVTQTNWVLDNSWHTRTGLDAFDLIVFAGTPEWYGRMLAPLTEAISASSVPVVYLGIGNFENREEMSFSNLPPDDQQSLSAARLLTVRDSATASQLAPLSPIHMPCPSLLAAGSERSRRTRKKFRIALNFQVDDSRQPPSSPGIAEYSFQLAEKIASAYECAWVCHYIDELPALRQLTELPVYYSYDPRDYFEIYDEFDLLITTRVHAAGAAASLGVPSFVIQHSARSETADGFLSEAINPAESADEVLGRIQKLKLNKWSAALVEHKRKTREHYTELLEPVLASLEE